MKSKVSRLLVFLSLTAVLAVAAVVGLEALLENRKEAIRRQMAEAIGRAVTFDTVHLSVLRHPGSLGITVTDLRVADDPRFAATPLIHATQTTISLGWLSLFTSNPTVSHIILNQPEVQVIRNEYGDVNIFTPAQPLSSDFRSVHTTVSATGGKLYFIDRSSDKPEELRIHHLDMALSWSAGRSVDVDLSGTLTPDGELPFSVTGTVGTSRPLSKWGENPVDLELRAESLPKVFAARGWKLLENHLPGYLRPSTPLAVSTRVSGRLARPRLSRMRVTGALFGAGADNAAFEGELDFSKAASWNEGRIKAELQLGPVTLEQLRQIPWVDRVLPAALAVHKPLNLANVVEGRLDDLKIHTSVAADANAVQYGKWLEKAPGVTARLAMAMRVRKNRLLIGPSEARLHTGTVAFSGSIHQHPEQVVRLQVKTADLPLAGWQDLVPAAAGYELDGTVNADFSLRQKSAPRNEPPTITGSLRLADINVIGPPGKHRTIQGLQGELEFRGRDIEIRNIQLRSGLSDLRLHGLLADLNHPTLHYSVQSNLLNLVDVTGDAAYRADSLSNLVSEGSAGFTEGVLAVKGHLASSNGRLKGVPYRNLRGVVRWSGAGVRVDGLDVEALGGRVRGGGAFTNRDGKGFEIEFNPAVESMELADLLAHLPLGPTDPVNGSLDLEGRFRSSGKDWVSVVRNLSGRGRFSLDKGVVANFNPVRRVLGGMDAVEGVDRIDAAGPAFISLVRDDRASFDRAEGTFTVDRGRFRSHDLRLIADEYSIVGKGWADADGDVDLQATLVLSSEFSRDLSGRYRNVRYLFDADGISVPFRLAGHIPDVTIRPNVVQLTRYMYDKLAEERPPRRDRDSGFNLWKRLERGFREMLR